MVPTFRSIPDDGETLDSLLHALTREEEQDLLDELELPEEDEITLGDEDEPWLESHLESVAAFLCGLRALT